MAGGGALNLSLLSRGVGEVQRNGHEKVEVFLEPEDYYNFRDNPNRLFLPPIQPNYAVVSDLAQFSSRDSKENHEIHLPKTFTTRKGALLLFSEDLALKDSERDPHETFGRSKDLENTTEAQNLKTVDDLAKSILSYGNNEGDSVYMKFLHRKRAKFQRQIRPGFSAKRYLATWTRSWDDHVLETVINKGYITERSLFQYNFVIPHLRRRIFHEDLSHYPPPYRLMRNMLLSPGSLSGYTFYRAIPEYEDMLDEYTKGDVDLESMRSRPPTSIKVIRTRNGEQREVSYASLDKKAQEEVITDLLVKSAVHYALRRQQEYLNEDIQEVEEANTKVTESALSESDQKASNIAKTPVQQFDMKDAVESLLDSHRQLNFDADLPAPDSASHSSYGGSFKGATLPHHSVKGHSAKTRSWPYGIDEAGKEYIGIAPVVSLREGSSSPSGSVTSLPQLPAIKKHPLTPIKDVSRETTQNIVLPPIHGADGVPLVNVEPPTPQHSTLTKPTQTDTARVDTEVHVLPSQDENDKRTDKGLPKRKKRVSGDQSHHSSMESIPHSGVQSIPSKNRPHWRGSQQSIASRKGPGSQMGDGSMKGSIICAPDGEIISVGGSVGPTRQSDVATLQDVMTATKRVGDGEMEESIASDGDEPDEWKQSRQRVHSEGVGVVLDRRHSHKDEEISKNIDPTPSMLQWNYVRGDEQEVPPSSHPPSVHSASIHTLSSGQIDQLRRESNASEQMLVDALTEHAQQIAQSVLKNAESGQNLEADIRQAASLWTDRHPTRDISRSQSVQEKPNTDAIEEIMRNQRTSSVDVTAAEYREQIRQSLTTAVAKATGLMPDSLPVDAEVSPELLDALANQSLSPEDIEIIHNEETGKSTLRSKSQLSKVMGGVKEGHIFVPPGGTEDQPVSIQAERVSIRDVGDVDVISYADPADQDQRSKGGSKASSKAPSVKDLNSDRSSERKPSETSQGAVDDLDVQDAKSLEKTSPSAEVPTVVSEPVISPDAGSEKGSTKTGISKVSQKSEDSKKSVKKKPIALEDREEFVVGKVKNTQELEQLYGPVEPPPPSKPSPPKPPAEKRSPEVVSPKEETSPQVEVKKESPREAETKVQSESELPALQPVKPSTISVQPPVKTETRETTPTKPEPKVTDEGRVDTKTELATLYAPPPAPPQQKKAVKGKPKAPPKVDKPLPPKREVKKKEKKQKKKKAEPVAPPPPVKEKTPPTTEPPRVPTPKKESPVPVESPDLYQDTKSEASFVFVRDTSETPELKHDTPAPREPSPPPIPREPSIEEQEEEDEEDETGPKQISSKDARLAKRAAAAAKKREEVERRRREKEEEMKRQKEEMERQEQLKREMEEERKRRDEERRLRKLREAEERKKEEQAALERERKKQQDLEREKRAKEEYQRKLEDMRKKQAEEEERRLEAQRQRELEEEEARRQEEEMMSLMAEKEREEYERRKKEEAELKRQREEEEKRRREEEAQKALEEAKRLAEEMARRQAELEARLKFNRDLQLESHGLTHTQDITRMFVFSYFELLQWLGLDIPEFELQKLLQFNKA